VETHAHQHVPATQFRRFRECPAFRQRSAGSKRVDWILDQNPSNGSVSFSFTMAKQGPASIRVYDVAGRLVKTLVSGTAEGGPHDIIWNATDDGGRRVDAGVYFYRIDAGSWRSQRKVVFLER
jgi:flagellar hook assembly protein FlgD